MRTRVLCLALLGLVTLTTPVAASSKCLICTLLAGLLEQIALDGSIPVGTAIGNLCTDVTKDLPFLAGICELALSLEFQAKIQTCVSNNVSPDDCCKTIGWCESTNQCVLFKKWPPPTPLSERHLGEPLLKIARGQYSQLTEAEYAPLMRAMGMTAAFFNADKAQDIPVADHLPLFDADGDYYSPAGPLRGFHWRGKDCDDVNKNVYPGRATTSYGPEVDHNCNGIVGTDSQGRSYEDLLCKGTGQRGIINLGDSVTAHFRIPDYYFRPAYINASTYSNLLAVAEDEADWPHCSWGTGFAPASDCPYSKLGVDSLMLKFRANNLCSHRDYQNVGVNGARTGSMAPPTGIITTMHNRTNDQPAVVFYALVGNDVCNGHPGFERMTTPQEFEANVLAALHYLDAALAPGSFVIMVGLADGRILYNTLQNETHPIGVPYPDFYDYLNCFQTSPCWGWMNTNETVRELTWTEHANVLNNVYPKIVAENTFQNFEMFYVPPDFSMIIDKWISMGGHARDLIEPVDGFHPSQTGNVLLAQQIWADLQANFSQAIGPENPNNAQIQALFGDQGGFGL